MIRLIRCAQVTLLAGCMAVLSSQLIREEPGTKDRRLPSGKLQKDEILKMEHKMNIEDADRLAELAASLKADLLKNDWHVLSFDALKKSEEMERLAKRIKNRLKRF